MLRTRITWLVAAVTSAVIVSFVLPLCLLVQQLAEDRAVSAARDQAQSVAALVATVPDEQQLLSVVGALDATSPVRTRLLLPSGRVVGASMAEPGEPDTGDEARGEALAVAARAQGRAFTERGGDDADVLIPVVLSAGVVVVHSHVEFDSVRQGLVTAWATIIGLGLLMLTVAIVTARALSDRISTPVTELADVAHRLREGELDARVVPAGPTEVVALGAALNRLADRIGELLHLEREAAADLSHRLRTPVTALRLDADLVRDPELGERLRAHVDDLHRAIDRLVADARRPTRAAMGGRCDLAEVLAARAAHWAPLAEDQERAVTLSLPTGPTGATGPTVAAPVAMTDHDAIDLVDTLVDNVFAHTAEGTALALTLTSDGGEVILYVDDAGPGADPAVLARGLSGAGSSGLGLDIVRRLAASAGGEVALGTAPLGGLRVSVRLPCSGD